MKKKTQILMVHGGNAFKNRKDYFHWLKNKKIKFEKKTYWFDAYFDKHLSKDFEIIKPHMPLPDYAEYKEWKIFFEKYIPYLKNNIILIGGSLGGIFLAKYLSENKFPKKILSTYLICAPFEAKDLSDGGFKLKSNLSLLEKNSRSLYLLFSKDDDVVPVSHAEKYRSKLQNAKIIIYDSKNGHFKVPKFPEIIKMIKQDIKEI